MENLHKIAKMERVNSTILKFAIKRIENGQKLGTSPLNYPNCWTIIISHH